MELLFDSRSEAPHLAGSQPFYCPKEMYRSEKWDGSETRTICPAVKPRRRIYV